MDHDGDGAAVPIAASSSSSSPTRREKEVSDAEWAVHAAKIATLQAEACLAIVRNASAPHVEKARPRIAHPKPHPVGRAAAPPTPRTPEVDPLLIAPISPLTPDFGEKDTNSDDAATKVDHDPVKRLEPTSKAALGTSSKCGAHDVGEEHVEVVEDEDVDEKVADEEQDDADRLQAVVDQNDRIAVLLERLAFLQEEFVVCKDELKAKGAWSRHLMHNNTNNERGGQNEKVHKVLAFVREGDLDALFEWAESKESVEYAKWFGWRVERYKKQGTGSKGSGTGSKGTGRKGNGSKGTGSKGSGSKGSGDGKSGGKSNKRAVDDAWARAYNKRSKKHSGTQSRR
jgi:hypothetical protein